MEHLTENDKMLAKNKNAKSSLHTFLGIAEVEEDQAAAVSVPKVYLYIFQYQIMCNIFLGGTFECNKSL